MKSASQIDIIVPTKNSESTLEDCLESLIAQTVPVNIIIVDGHSEDGTVEIAGKHGAIILFEPRNMSSPINNYLSLAKNVGLKRSKAEIVGFLDSDVVVPNDWAEKMSRYLGHRVGAVTSGCTQNHDRLLPLAFSIVQQIGSSSHRRQFRKLTEITSAQAYNAMYLRKALDDAGRFDETLQGCEDWELNYRLRKKGWKILGVPECPVYHKPRTCLKEFAKEIFGYGWSRSHLLRKKRIFTLLHALPTLALLGFSLSFFLHFELYLIAVYLFTTTMLSIVLLGDELNFKTLFMTIIAFAIFHLSWAIGYLKGLMK